MAAINPAIYGEILANANQDNEPLDEAVLAILQNMQNPINGE